MSMFPVFHHYFFIDRRYSHTRRRKRTLNSCHHKKFKHTVFTVSWPRGVVVSIRDSGSLDTSSNLVGAIFFIKPDKNWEPRAECMYCEGERNGGHALPYLSFS